MNKTTNDQLAALFVNSVSPIDRLTVHPVADRLPMLPTDHPIMQALVSGIRAHGLLNPLTVNEHSQVISGRHRFAAAKLAGLTQVPTQIVPVDDKEIEALVTQENLVRNNLSQDKRALAICAYHAEALDAAKQRRVENLKKGKNPNVFPNVERSTIRETRDSLAERFGVCREYLIWAASLWKAAHPDPLGGFVASCDSSPSGNDSHEATKAQSAGTAIQVRALELIAKVWSDEISLSGAYRGLAGSAASASKKRAEPNYGVIGPAAAVGLANAFKNWAGIKKMRDEDRERMYVALLEIFTLAPPEVRAINIEAIGDWPKHDRAELVKTLKALREE